MRNFQKSHAGRVVCRRLLQHPHQPIQMNCKLLTSFLHFLVLLISIQDTGIPSRRAWRREHNQRRSQSSSARRIPQRYSHRIWVKVRFFYILSIKAYRYLRLWLNELRAKDPIFAESIHVFSSFFYKKLNKKK